MAHRRREIAGEGDVIGHRNIDPNAPKEVDLFTPPDQLPPAAGTPDRMRHPVAKPTLPFTRTTDTSEEAAAAHEEKAPKQRQQVHNFLISRGDTGATRREIEDALGLRGNSVHPRVLELLEGKHIQETKHRRDGGNVLKADRFAPYCPGCNTGSTRRFGSTETCARCQKKLDQADEAADARVK